MMFSRETKKLRARQNELRAEVHGLIFKEKRLANRLRLLNQSQAELDADRSELEDGD